ALRMDSQQRNSFGRVAHDHRERGFDASRAVRHIALVPMASNIPDLVGMRVDATRQSSPVCAALIVFALIPSFLGVLAKIYREAYAARSFAFGVAPLARKPSMSLALKPSCWRTSSLCSPSAGARLAGSLATPCT